MSPKVPTLVTDTSEATNTCRHVGIVGKKLPTDKVSAVWEVDQINVEGSPINQILKCRHFIRADTYCRQRRQCRHIGTIGKLKCRPAVTCQVSACVEKCYYEAYSVKVYKPVCSGCCAAINPSIPCQSTAYSLRRAISINFGCLRFRESQRT